MTRKNAKKTKNVRFPNDILRQVEQICAQTGCSFSDFVKQAVCNALNDLHNERETP